MYRMDRTNQNLGIIEWVVNREENAYGNFVPGTRTTIRDGVEKKDRWKLKKREERFIEIRPDTQRRFKSGIQENTLGTIDNLLRLQSWKYNSSEVLE